jgi:hypothetical protein
MSNKNYDEASIIKILNRVQGVSVNQADKIINVNKHNHSLGNSGWGKVDFLIHYCGYYLSWDYDKKVIISPTQHEEQRNKRKKEVFSLKNVVKDIMSNCRV